MSKALVAKELRETAGLGLLALVFSLAYVSGRMGVGVIPWASTSVDWIPFVSDSLLGILGLIWGVLAAVLGLRQTAWESAFATDLFLLHRPIGRRRIVTVKLLVGAAVLLTAASLAILVYAWWAATPGKHASPFFWPMTLSFWEVAISMTMVYLAAFLSGLRPARWVGSRLAPLAAGSILAFLVSLLSTLSVSGWGAVRVLLVMLVDALFLVAVFFAAENRDY